MTDADRYLDIGLLHDHRSLGFGIARRRLAAYNYRQAADGEADFVDGETLGPRSTDSGQDATPIRIAREQRGFDQRRFRHRIGDARTILLAVTTADRDGDEFGRAFAIAYDVMRETQTDGLDRRHEFAVEHMAFAVYRRRAARTGSDQNQRVVGRRIAIDGDAVEAARGRGAGDTAP